MDEQRRRGRVRGPGEAAVEACTRLAERVGRDHFLGYGATEVESGSWRSSPRGAGRRGEAAGGPARSSVIVQETPFYGEQGGQMGDTGRLIGPRRAARRSATPSDRVASLFVHLGRPGPAS